MAHRILLPLLAGLALFLDTAAAFGQRPSNPDKPAANQAFESSLRSELDRLGNEFNTQPSAARFGPDVDRLFDLAIAHCIPASDATLVRDINLLRRRIRFLATLRPEEVAPIKKFLADNPALARTVLSAIGPDDDIPNALRVLSILHSKFPDRVRDAAAPAPRRPGQNRESQGLAELVAAFCIVYDNVPRGAKEPDAARVSALFDYFSANFDKLTCEPGTAPELLAIIVATPVSVEELDWALKNYRGNRSVGKLYGTIVYDTAAFKFNRPKKVMSQPGGYTLMNIKKVGGVCAEQAYFASNVGKAIGVPAVTVTGRGADVGHAWVGYLKGFGTNRAEWDFDEGRYREYQGLRGSVLDPQSGNSVPDGFIALTAGYTSLTAEEREMAVAYFDASERIAAVELAKTRFPPDLTPGTPSPTTTARTLGVNTQVDLIESGLRSCHVARRGWDMIARLATTEKLSAEQLDTWSKRVIEMCGDDYPDFSFAMLSPMVRVITPPEQQDKFWEWLHGKFNRRKDLAAAVRFEQALLWENAGNPAKAWDLYNECIERYPNDGTIIVDALKRAEQLLNRQGRADQAVSLYQNGWSRISKPEKMSNEFSQNSNYVVVGRRYADLLEGIGKAIDAKKVRDAVAAAIGKAA